MMEDRKQLLVDKFKIFWKPGDEIICTRIFRWSNNNCYLCGHTPIEWHHVLLNTVSNQTIDVEFSCVINIKKILEELGSDQKILFFHKYTEEVNHLNSKYQGTAAMIAFNSNTEVIIGLLSNPNDLSYKQVRSILDYTVKFSEGNEAELFHAALDIYTNRKYYIYEMLDDHEKTNNVEQSIENYFREEWDRVRNNETEYQSASYNVHINDRDCPF
jgi:hypothetical protein